MDRALVLISFLVLLGCFGLLYSAVKLLHGISDTLVAIRNRLNPPG